jgi:hypothetical protein
MNNVFFQGLEKALAVERLDAFRQDGASQLTTLSRYLWNMALCEALYSPLQMAEVALRNSIHSCFSEQFSTEDWYTTSGLLLSWQEKLVDEAIETLKERGVPISAEMVISELHFGFWTGFFNKAHEKNGVAHSLIKPVFKYAPKYERVVGPLSERWNEVRNLRNRIFHHERIVHWSDLVQQHARLIEVIGWINPELHEMAEALDRFTMIHSARIEPWKEKIQQHWPKEVGNE